MDISKDSDQSLVKKCFEFCSALTDRGCSYSFSLKLGQSFNFSLKSEKGAPPKAKPKRSPSYLRRQLRRKEEFLKKRSRSSPENVEAASRQIRKIWTLSIYESPINWNTNLITKKVVYSEKWRIWSNTKLCPWTTIVLYCIVVPVEL